MKTIRLIRIQISRLVGSTEQPAVKTLPADAGDALSCDFLVAFPIANHYMSGCAGLAAGRLICCGRTSTEAGGERETSSIEHIDPDANVGRNLTQIVLFSTIRSCV
jgi:hypothetical protein